MTSSAQNHPGVKQLSTQCYQTLRKGDIRLLTFDPNCPKYDHFASGKYIPRLTFSSHGLRDPPPYIALSYRWGTKSEDCFIQLNGQLLGVRENLHRALRHLRVACPTSMLWIDALCIDQSNDEERNEQVRSMGSIFASSRKTIAWLGPRIGSYAMAVTNGSFLQHDFGTALAYFSGEGNIFSRVWCMQEYV